MFNVILKKSDRELMERKGYHIVSHTGEEMISIYNWNGNKLIELVYDYMTNKIIVMTKNIVEYCMEVKIINSKSGIKLIFKVNEIGEDYLEVTDE